MPESQILYFAELASALSIRATPLEMVAFDFGAVDRQRALRDIVEREEAALFGVLEEGRQVELGQRAGAESRRDRTVGIFKDRLPGPARPLEDDRDRARADRHQPRHAGRRAERAAVDVGGEQPDLDLRALGLAVEAKAGLDVAAEGRGVGNVEDGKPVLDLRGRGDIGELDGAGRGMRRRQPEIEIDPVGETGVDVAWPSPARRRQRREGGQERR